MRISNNNNNSIYLLLFILSIIINIITPLLVEENQPCNTERDILLAADPHHNPQAYLQCVGANIGTIGFWNKKFCTPDNKFDFSTQGCVNKVTTNDGGTFNFNAFKSYPTLTPNTKQGNYYNPTFEQIPDPLPEPALKVAILNNTCSNGETCIGGTVCDTKKGKCLCPFGTIPNLATLSCDEEVTSPMIVSSIQEEDGTFKFTFRKQGPYVDKGVNELIMKKDSESLGNDKIDFVGNKNGPTQVNIKPFNILESLFSKPGEKCNDGKICTGGSLCITSSMLCLCPGTLVEKNGECVNPHNGAAAVEKVKVGGLCNSFTECLDDSSCILGRCRCVLPLYEVNGKCLLKMPVKEVGPGEVCEHGEICTKGSVCDATIPVCICPPGTDLNNNDECVAIPKIITNPPTTTTTTSTMRTTTTSTTTSAPIIITQTTHKPFIFQTTTRYENTRKINEYYTQQQTTVPPTTTSRTVISTIYTQPSALYKKISKPLSIGAKFLKVGETCSLNTDCMIGAYCNGNSNPASCQCLSTHVNVNGKCEKVIYPGQYGCKNDLQCSTSYPGASCHDRQCVCPLNYRAVEQTCISEDFFNTNILTHDYPFNEINDMILTNESRLHSITTLPGKENDGVAYNNKKEINNFKKLKKVVRRQVKIQSVSDFYKTNIYQNQVIMSRQNDDTQSSDNFVCLPGQFVCAKDKGVCYQSVCYCFEGYYPDYDKSECLKIVNQFDEPKAVGIYVNIGDNCRIHIDRCLGGSFCDSATYRCTCPVGSIFDNKNETCLQPPGNSCVKGEICTNGSVCDFGVCSCPPSHEIINNFCLIKIVSLNGICLNGERCMPGLVCRLGRCGEDFFGKKKDIINFKNSLPKIAISRVGEKCLMDEYCLGNSLCINGFCKCKEKVEVLVDGMCKKLITTIIECPEGKHLIDNQCIEDENLIKPTNNEIFSKIKKQEDIRLPIAGEKCTSKCGSGAFCNNGICQCPPTSVVDFLGRCRSLSLSQNNKHRHASLVHTTTILKSHLHSLPGESCKMEETNCLGYSICKNSICSCPDDKVLQGNVCLDEGKTFPQIIIKKLEYDDRNFNEGEVECDGNDKDYENDSSCPGGMKCYKNKCLCDVGYTLREGECQLSEAGSVEENGECVFSVQCVDELTCLNGYSTDRLISPPGGSCGDDETCTGGSICKNDWCVCPDINMLVLNGLCLTSDILASTKIFEIPTTIQTPQQPSIYNQINIQQPNQNPSHVDIAPSSELPTFGETFQTKVEKPFVVEESNVNRRKVAPGMNCGPLDVCVGGSHCFDNYCVCPTGMVVDTTSGRCTTDEEEKSLETSTGTQSFSIHTYKNNNTSPNKLINNNYETTNDVNINNYINDKITTESTKNSQTLLPLPNSQLYVIRRPSSSYNSLTSSFLSSNPGMDIRDMMPKIIKYDNNATSTRPSNIKTNPNINNDNSIPTFANIFSNILSNNINNPSFTPDVFGESNSIITSTGYESNKESYIGDKMNSYSNNNNNNNNSPTMNDECTLNGLICRGGAICINASCQCPSNYVLFNDQCVPPTGRRYSQRRGKQNLFTEDSTSNPNESCSNGEKCLGGSICQDEKCPDDKKEIVDGVCITSTIKEKLYGPGEECGNEKMCKDNAECHQGICRCVAGYITISNDCIQLPNAQSQSITNNAPNSEEPMKTMNSGYGSSGSIMHSDDDKPKPRFVAPSIRRPKPKSNKSKNSGGTQTMSGEGTCPSGNPPTRDEATNRVLTCNGMTPNCPPRSYCYVTGGADGVYNCCKSF
uniref:EGF-like domain-containing protein n=1 Tax=Parastrongyloides trichosuri TaxID=131310 RepID=A0A0N4ZLV6_PARTI